MKVGLRFTKFSKTGAGFCLVNSINLVLEVDNIYVKIQKKKY